MDEDENEVHTQKYAGRGQSLLTWMAAGLHKCTIRLDGYNWRKSESDFASTANVIDSSVPDPGQPLSHEPN